MYVCATVRVYVCVCVLLCLCVGVCVRVCMCACVYICVGVCVHTPVFCSSLLLSTCFIRHHLARLTSCPYPSLPVMRISVGLYLPFLCFFLLRLHFVGSPGRRQRKQTPSAQPTSNNTPPSGWISVCRALSGRFRALCLEESGGIAILDSDFLEVETRSSTNGGCKFSNFV